MARNFITIVFTILLTHGFVSAKKVAGTLPKGVKIIMEQPLIAPGPDIFATSLVVEYQPGDAGTDPHFHAGPTVGSVIEGEFLFQVHGKPPRIIPAGEAFYELDRDIHVWSGNASNSTICKITATIFGRPNEVFMTFVKDYKRESREEAIAQVRLTPDLTAPSTAERIKDKDDLKK